MAPIASVILLLLTLSSTIHARESQFFAKVSNNNPQETQPLITNQGFVPQSQEGGVYGHEAGQLPPSTTDNNNNNNNNNNNIDNNRNNLPSYLPENFNPVAYTTPTPIHSSTQDFPNEYNEPQEYNSQKQGGYNSQKQGMGETRYGTTNNANMYNPEKRMISETRYLENGKYFYDADHP